MLGFIFELLGSIFEGAGAKFQKQILINDRDFQFFGLCQFASRLLARDDEICLFANRTADPSAASLDVSLSVIPLHSRQSPRYDKGLSLEYSRRLAPPGARRLHLHSRFGETFH